MHRTDRTIALIASLLLLLAVPLAAGPACQPEERSGSSSSAGPAAPGAVPPGQQAEPATLSLPAPGAPRALPAERVVHLLYTSNVAGEAEPCG